MPVNNRNLGKLGENAFSSLCAAVGLISNPSNEDSSGWDFIVDFPQLIDSSVYADKSPAPIECKVQVKASDKLDKKIQIPLSNLMRLCQSPLPTFIFFLEFNNKEVAECGYLFHFDKEVIFKVLKKSREISVSDHRPKSNKTTLTITYNDSHKLKFLTGQHLKEKIEEYIPNGMGNYISNKQSLLTNLGYENGYAEVQFKTNSLDAMNDLIDASLGWNNKVKINDLRSFDKRFGINIPLDDMSGNEAILTFGEITHTAEIDVKFINKAEKIALRFPSKLYTSGFSISATEKHSKFRIKSNIFDIIVEPFSGLAKYNFTIDNNEMPLYEIRDAMKTITWITSGEHEIEMQIKLPTSKKSLNFQLGSKKGSVQAKLDFELKKTIENAIFIAQKVGLESQIKTTINDIDRHRKSIYDFSRFLKGTPDNFKIKFTVEPKSFYKKHKNFDCHCLIVVSTKLGSNIVHGIITLFGIASLVGKEYEMVEPKINFEDIFSYDEYDDIKSELSSKVDTIIETYQNKGEKVIDFYNVKRK